MDEMVQHVDKHTSALRGIQSIGMDVYLDVPRSQDRLAPQLAGFHGKLNVCEKTCEIRAPIGMLVHVHKNWTP